MTLLAIKGLRARYNAGDVLHGIDIAVEEGEIVALLGANGAGKTTTLRAISGLLPHAKGSITLAGQPILGKSPGAIVRAGLAHVPEGRRIFPGLTVRENILLGASNRPSLSLTVLENVVIGAERPGNDLRAPAAVVARALAALEFVGLRREAVLPVTALPYGHQRYVEIARALAGSPDLLLLDEPAAGLNSTEKQELGALLRQLKQHGLTILIIEHDMNLIEAVADHITVLNFGRCIADGAPRAVLSHPDVIAAYLGEPRSA